MYTNEFVSMQCALCCIYKRLLKHCCCCCCLFVAALIMTLSHARSRNDHREMLDRGGRW